MHSFALVGPCWDVVASHLEVSAFPFVANAEHAAPVAVAVGIVLTMLVVVVIFDCPSVASVGHVAPAGSFVVAVGPYAVAAQVSFVDQAWALQVERASS